MGRVRRAATDRRAVRGARAAVAVAFGAIVLTGCATSSGGSGGAGSLTVYSGQHVQTTQQLVAAFEKETGISVNLRSDDEDVLADQIVTEGSHSPADVFYAENSPPLQYLDSKGLLAPVDPSILSATPTRFNSPDGTWVGVSARVSVMVYNTSLLKPSELPTSVMQLADPEWKGRIGMAGSETDFQPIVTSIARTHGDRAALSWLEAVKANAGGHDYPDNETVTSQVNRGQVALGVINQYYWYRERAEVGSGRHAFGHRHVRSARPRLRPGCLGSRDPLLVVAQGGGPAVPGLPDVQAGPGDHRPQRQLRVPDRLGGDDGTARDPLRPARAERHLHRGARHGRRGDQAPPRGAALVNPGGPATTAPVPAARHPGGRPAPAAAPGHRHRRDHLARRALAPGLPGPPGGPGRVGPAPPAPVPPSDRHARMEHGVAPGGGDRSVRGAGNLGRLVRRADRSPVPAGLRRARGDPAGDPGLRGQLRLAGPLPLVGRVLGRRAHHDARRLPARVPARRRQSAGGRSRRRRRSHAAWAWAGSGLSGP